MKKLSVVKKITPTASSLLIVVFSLLSFLSGAVYAKARTQARLSEKDAVFFIPKKFDRPELIFFTTSFCPYGNEIESVIRPVFDTLRLDSDFTPRYLFQKVTDLEAHCRQKSDSSSGCLNPKNYLRSAGGVLYTSIFGRQEMNQNIREICAWNLAGENKSGWWDFVSLVNKNCNADNADSCWQENALKTGLDTTAITDCFNKNAFTIIEQELAQAMRYKVAGVPAMLINDSPFPPQTVSFPDSKVKIGKNNFSVSSLRAPDTIKSALCESFKKKPKVCQSTLPPVEGLALTTKGCSNL